MTKPVNLRQFRKRKARDEKAKTAEANRIAHGTPKAVRDLAKARAKQDARALDALKRETDADTDTDTDGSKNS
jgi:hypothetical protein